MKLRRSLIGDYKLAALVIAAFGPYVVGGTLRTDHLLIYGLFMMSLGQLAVGGKSVLRIRPLADVRLLLLALLCWVTGITVLERGYQSVRQLGGGFENYLQPLAVVTITSMAIVGKSAEELRELAVRLINLYLLLLLLNTFISVSAIGTTLIGRGDVVPSVLGRFWGQGNLAGETTAQRALHAFRFSGIFDQPFEAGLHHSFGLFLAVFVTRLERRWFARRDYVRMIVVGLGGLTSLSKVILFGGIPCLVIYLIWERRLGRLLRSRFVLLIAFATAIPSAILLPQWAGFSRLSELSRFWTSTNVIRLLTGTRFGSAESQGVILVNQILASSPVIGLGFGSFAVYDSAYLEYWAQGGLIALFVYLLLLGVFGWHALRLRRVGEGRFYAVVLVLIILVGVGSPVITVNRFAVVFWTLMTVLFTRDALLLRRRAVGDSQSQRFDHLREYEVPVAHE